MKPTLVTVDGETSLVIPREFCTHDPALDDRLRRLVADAAAAVEAEEATIWLISEDHELLRVAINHGRTPAVLESFDQPVRPSAVGQQQSIVGLVYQLHQALGKPIDGEYDQTVDSRTGTVTRTMAAVPLDIGQHRVGVLSAINRAGDRMFDGDSLDALRAGAQRVSLALREFGADPDAVGAS